MSEEAKEQKEEPTEGAPKKKASKLPIIVALALLLAGGGFFMMKGRGTAPKKKEAPALGTIEPVKEMLVNLSGGTSYLKVEIALHMVKDFKKEDLEKNKEAVTDAIIMRLKSKKLSEIQTTDQLKELKGELAGDVNAVLNADKKDDPGGDAKDKAAKPDDVPVPPDYDSKTGPVLKVYFTSFATQ